jgi:hypothetical protein
MLVSLKEFVWKKSEMFTRHNDVLAHQNPSLRIKRKKKKKIKNRKRGFVLT